MESEKEHRKVKYTKMVIRQALLELLDTKPLKQITVKSLCELADINRGTFYSHYTDIYDLVEKLEDELIVKLASMIQFENIGEGYQLEMFAELFMHIKSNIDDYKIMLINPESSRCLDEILAKVHHHHATALMCKNPQLSQNMIDYSFAFLASGSNKVVLKWIENDFEESPEEMAKLIYDYTNCGIAALDNN